MHGNAPEGHAYFRGLINEPRAVRGQGSQRMHLSPLVTSLVEPATLLMARRSRELKAQGRDIIDLSLGEPDHEPAPFAIAAAHEAIDGPWHKYPPVNGFLDVRQAIAKKFKRDNGLEYTADQVMVSTGAKQSIMNVVMALVGPGDEVVIPAPFWVTYAEQVKMAGATPVIVPSTLEEDWKAPVERIAAAITPRTRLLMFSSPCNPSGSVLTKEEMEALADVVRKHPGLYVISDEIYEHIIFNGMHRSFAALPGMMERTITVNGLSKAFALTGWRVGYIGAPLWITQAAMKIQGQFTSGANSIAQRVTIACMEADPKLLGGMRTDFLRRRDLLVKALKAVPGWRCNVPEGAFYVLPDASSSLNGTTIRTSVDLCLFLLDTAGVGIVEGDSFGAPNTVRISYATSDDKLVEAVDRIAKALSSH
jgi:aspartate aminotransferase